VKLGRVSRYPATHWRVRAMTASASSRLIPAPREPIPGRPRPSTPTRAPRRPPHYRSAGCGRVPPSLRSDPILLRWPAASWFCCRLKTARVAGRETPHKPDDAAWPGQAAAVTAHQSTAAVAAPLPRLLREGLAQSAIGPNGFALACHILVLPSSEGGSPCRLGKTTQTCGEELCPRFRHIPQPAVTPVNGGEIPIHALRAYSPPKSNRVSAWNWRYS
jgi:hypothetical protein